LEGRRGAPLGERPEADDRAAVRPADAEQRAPNHEAHPAVRLPHESNTKGGDVVLDLFGGSGTSIMAAEQNGRTCCMMEYDPRYIDVIIDRWEKFTGETAELTGK